MNQLLLEESVHRGNQAGWIVVPSTHPNELQLLASDHCLVAMKVYTCLYMSIHVYTIYTCENRIVNHLKPSQNVHKPLKRLPHGTFFLTISPRAFCLVFSEGGFAAWWKRFAAIWRMLVACSGDPMAPEQSGHHKAIPSQQVTLLSHLSLYKLINS